MSSSRKKPPHGGSAAASSSAAKSHAGDGELAASLAQDERRSGRLRTKVRIRSVVDPETRRQVAAARLVQLETDNYEEPTHHHSSQAQDAAYEEEVEEEEIVQLGGNAGANAKNKKRKSRTAGSRPTAAEKKSLQTSAAAAHRLRNLDHVIAEEEYDTETPGEINYKTIASSASRRPQRHFCSVCGFQGTYTCTRCGLRFCSMRCQKTHKETRCVKFAE